jgi:hypothetical protein
MLIAGMEPERVGFDQLQIGNRLTAEPTFQIFVKHFGLDRICYELFGDGDILGGFWDYQTKFANLCRLRLAIIPERQTMSNLIVVCFLVIDLC